MSWFAALATVLSIAWAIFQALTGSEAVKAAAQKALLDQFATLEAQGQPILRNLVLAAGRTTFDDWANVPVTPQPPATPPSALTGVAERTS